MYYNTISRMSLLFEVIKVYSISKVQRQRSLWSFVLKTFM